MFLVFPGLKIIYCIRVHAFTPETQEQTLKESVKRFERANAQ